MLIPGYSLTFREEANEQLHKPGKSSATSSLQELKDRRKQSHGEFVKIMSSVLLCFFIGIGIICWLVCSLVLSVGTYIGAQHIFGSFAYSTIISDAIFVIDFLYQLNYYSTELCRKISNKLMTYMPCSHCFFFKQTEQDQPLIEAVNAVNNNTIILK